MTQTGTLGSIALLESIRTSDKQIKFYQASSSEMYGGTSKVSLNEESLFDPKSPMQHLKYLHITLQKFIESPTTFSV